MSTDQTYGVQYSPSTVYCNALSLAQLHHCNIRYVRIQWIDYISHIRYRILPIAYFTKLVKSESSGSRPGITITKASLGLVFITLAPGFGATGEYLYVPDMQSLRLCPYAGNDCASVMGWFEEKASSPSPRLDASLGVRVDLCPRTTLRRIIEEAKSTSGIEFLVGFETEFILLKSTNPIEAANEHGWSVSAALLTGSVEAKVLEEIADCLEKSGIELQMYHAESAPGQYEIVTGPLPPLQAADALIHTRETIFNIANKHGLRATLAPRVYSDNCGSAAHAHISIHKSKAAPSPLLSPLPISERNLSAAQFLSSNESSFLASLLNHLPALTALTLPLTASYKRMLDGVWSGGTYVCWGTDNREAPIRLCNALSPSRRNFEVKMIDGTANPYLALSGILGIGSLGIKEGTELTIKDCDGPQSAAEMGEEARLALGITQRLPLSLEEARDRLNNNASVRNVLGNELVDKYLAVNETLSKGMSTGNGEGADMIHLVRNY